MTTPAGATLTQKWLTCPECGLPYLSRTVDDEPPEPRCAPCLLALRDECE